MKSYKLSGKQLFRISIQVILIATLWILPELMKPYILDSKSIDSNIYQILTFVYWAILLIGFTLWERKFPSKPFTDNSKVVLIPMWRKVLVISLIPLALCLVVYFH
jgi:hypothetical protein